MSVGGIRHLNPITGCTASPGPSYSMPVEDRTVHIPLENGKDLSVTVQDLVDVILIDNPELLNKLKLHKGLQNL